VPLRSSQGAAHLQNLWRDKCCRPLLWNKGILGSRSLPNEYCLSDRTDNTSLASLTVVLARPPNHTISRDVMHEKLQHFRVNVRNRRSLSTLRLVVRDQPVARSAPQLRVTAEKARVPASLYYNSHRFDTPPHKSITFRPSSLTELNVLRARLFNSPKGAPRHDMVSDAPRRFD
jgi:hypothetical protein